MKSVLLQIFICIDNGHVNMTKKKISLADTNNSPAFMRLLDMSVLLPGKGRVLGPSCPESGGHAGLRPEQPH